jgi:hypothetical protein
LIYQKQKAMTQKFTISYTKANGQQSSFTVKARNENEAIGNAKNICYTGTDFKVVGIAATDSITRKGNQVNL